MGQRGANNGTAFQQLWAIRNGSILSQANPMLPIAPHSIAARPLGGHRQHLVGGQPHATNSIPFEGQF